MKSKDKLPSNNIVDKEIDSLRRNNFDFLRFALAFTVVVSHIIDITRNKDMLGFRNFFDSYLAVTGFFIISGFLITKSLYNSKNIRVYLIKRARRLLPAYVTVILSSSFLLSLVSSANFSDYFSDSDLFKYVYCNLLFLNFLQPCLPGVFINNIMCAVNGALWTIKVEVSFYLVLPVLLFFIKKIKKKGCILLVIYVLSIIYKQSLIFLSQSYPYYYLDILSYQLPGFMSYFVCGIGLHYYFSFFLKHMSRLFPIALILFTLEYIFKMEILRPLAFSLIIFFLSFNFPILNKFGKKGDFSYGLYIFHFPLIQLFVHFSLFEKYDPFFISFVLVCLILLVSVASWNLLEKRFLERK